MKIGRITIRITEIKNENNSNDYYLNQKKSGNNLSNNSINIINSNNNSRIINEIVEITDIKKNHSHSNQNIESFRIGTNQATAITTKQNLEEKNNLENKNDINIINENSENEKESNSNESNNEDYKNKRKNNKNKICRICYMEEDDAISNPLLNPCICSGSMKYIHFQCLRHWINSKCYSKINNNNSNCSIYKIKPVECELCKTKFPDLIIKNDIKYNISEFKPDFDNCLIFESLTLDKNKNKYIYIVSLNNNEENKIYIGRDKESTVLFSDISVSRIHCLLNIDNNHIYINDEDSAFGTLVLMQTESINLIEDLPLYIQIGRTFFQILVKKNKSNFFCCNTSEKPNDKFYFNQNEKNIFYHKKITMLKLDDNINKENRDDLKKINGNKKENESNINIKKIVIKKNKINNSVIGNKNNIKSYLSNYENTEKVNVINDYSVNSKSLRKIKMDKDLIEQNNYKNINSIEIKINNLNKENEILKKDLIDNNINENSKNSNTQSIYLDEEN